MKLTNDLGALFGRFLSMSTLNAKTARLAIVATLMAVMLPMIPGTAHAAPARAHVYLMRGVFNIFSLGMDQIANRLQAQGIEASTHNHTLWSLVANDAIADYRNGKIDTVILVGHSSGATVLPDMVAKLTQNGVPVKLAIGLDSVFHTSLSGKVGRYINLYVANGAGTRVDSGRGLQGKLENVDVSGVPGVGHLTIDKNEAIQRKVIGEIDAAVRSGPGPTRMARPERQPASGTKPPSQVRRTARSAAN